MIGTIWRPWILYLWHHAVCIHGKVWVFPNTIERRSRDVLALAIGLFVLQRFAQTGNKFQLYIRTKMLKKVPIIIRRIQNYIHNQTFYRFCKDSHNLWIMRQLFRKTFPASNVGTAVRHWPRINAYVAVRHWPRRGHTMNDPRSSRCREAAHSAPSRHRATWGLERGEWKDLEEVSRGQQDNGTEYCCDVPFYKNK